MSEQTSENCNHNCSSCGSDCSERKESFLEATNEFSHVKKVIGVISGKGGVGKSMVTSLLAVLMKRQGYQTAILDADITGPSIPKAFGVKEKAKGNETGILPNETTMGIKMMSVNLLLPDETDPVIWRGPVIAGTVKQFWTDVIWEDVDYMFVDMPPGTGDVPLTVFQSLPVDGAVVVTAPQALVGMIVTKAVRMAEMLDVPVLGLVENYSFFRCPGCGGEHPVFGPSTIDALGKELSLPVLAKLSIDPELARAVDEGRVESYEPNPMAEVARRLDEA